jgi:nucleoid DNA-binding protein
LERDLSELLHLHDCVIVPGWGGFLAHHRPARLDEARQVIDPPSKELGFNRHLVRNDGLLADHLARCAGTDFEEASASIAAVVASWRERLEREGRLELSHLGIFYRDAEGNLQFDPDRRSNYLRDAFGLRPLRARVVEVKPLPAEVPVLSLPPAAAVPEPTNGALSVLRWSAAAAALLLVGVAGYWALEQGPLAGTRWSDLDPFRRAPVRYVAPSAEQPPPVAAASVFTMPDVEGVVSVPLVPEEDLVLLVDTRIVGHGTSDAGSSVAAVDHANAPADIHDRFHIIGGCFAQSGNADRKLAQLRSNGYPARRLRKRGDLHPVAFGSYATRAEALQALATVRANGEGSAWLLEY